MDWDRIKAKDLLALFSSFKPKDGVVLSVTIYPSEFGKERMKAEETQGPLELTNLPDDPEADTEDQRIYREKVRDYQFKRLRYYYAVVECDSVETAAKIYEECDGFEYESSCSMVDLRYCDTFSGLKATAEKLVKKKLEGKDKLTPWEEFLEKKKEKKKEKRKEKKEEVAISDDELPADVDLDDPFFAEESKKNKNKVIDHLSVWKSIIFSARFKQVDVQDPRFQAMFTSHLYNLDPSDPAYKKTKATQSILEEKQKRREQQEEHGQKGALKRQKTAEKPNKNSKEMDPSLSMLIKSIKNKTEQFQARKKQRIK
uniref:ESF1, nucleolar pre-rRNA processing protein, homolog (S. cerevisiae) n=1 Tax=Astyanax mexicanus TaxID=7994 RepID=A0A8B9JB91_ASTMX